MIKVLVVYFGDVKYVLLNENLIVGEIFVSDKGLLLMVYMVVKVVVIVVGVVGLVW